MDEYAHLKTYWIVIAGLPHSGKTTFLNRAAEFITLRDRHDMSLITADERDRVLNWLERTGGALDPDRTEPSRDEILFNRWARRITIGEIILEPDLRVGLYEAPSTREFDFLWQVITPETYLGAIVMIDSTAHHTIRDASRLAATFAAYADEPYIFAANKQDLPDAMSAEDIRILLQFLDGHLLPVIPCNANDQHTVQLALIRLLELIRDSFDDGIQW